jgi:predicted AlkP superfamily pyrophosphatase or phosphodiesterase
MAPVRSRAVAVVLVVCGAVAAAVAAQTPLPRTPLILVSFDGWRWDYHTKTALPHLSSVMRRGVRAERLIPSYPTKTFPNHYTLVTGLYPGHHGIVANSIRDPGTGRLFGLSARTEVGDPMWWGGEPIWVTLARAGGKAAPYFWPGAEAPIGGRHAEYWMPYDGAVTPAERVDRVLGWLDLPPADRPSFITLYFSDVDTAGHWFGPESAEVVQAMRRVDAALGQLLSGLDARRLIGTVNLVVTSDHGMAESSRRRVIVVDDLVPAADGIIVDLDPTLGVWPHAGREEALYQRLANAHPRQRVYRRAETPAGWHYRDHPRIPPIVGVADEGWSILRRARLSEAFSRTPQGIGGAHGYDPRVTSMHTLFVAAGPAFRQGAVVAPFENVSVYEALCRALGLTPRPHDGDPDVAKRLLR